MGADIPLTEVFVQDGASAETLLGLAVVAVAVSSRAGTPFVLGYIASGAALIVGVVNLLGFGFLL